ncbi:recombinase family protein [Serratia marcescens]|uniref:recombinase family protein n=1 Tax=Serratia marcescens TaxID=615 RepID=UPI0011E6F4E2|nr:recombinase family protein [Serratia marcescens]
MNLYYGYHRVSTQEQHLDRGVKELQEFVNNRNIHLQKVYVDKQTGKDFNRPRYIVLKEDVLRPGDTLLITECDRLGRNKKAILKELQYYKDNNIRVMILEIPTTLMDFSTFTDQLAAMLIETINNMLIEMYAAYAQAEMEKRQKRQREGIETMKLRGEWEKYGRPRALSLQEFKKHYGKVEKKEITATRLMEELNISDTTYYRYKKELEKE